MGEFEYQKKIIQMNNRDVLADSGAMYNSVIKASIQAQKPQKIASTEDECLEAYNFNNDEFAKLKRLAIDFMYLENPDDVVLRNLLIRNMPLFKDDSLIERNDRERQSRK